MKKVRFVGLIFLTLALWVFRAELLAWDCVQQPPFYVICQNPMATYLSCDEYGSEAVAEDCVESCAIENMGFDSGGCYDDYPEDIAWCRCIVEP